MRCRACSVCSVVLQWSKSPAKLITYHLYILMFLKFRYRVHHKVTVTVPFGLHSHSPYQKYCYHGQITFRVVANPLSNCQMTFPLPPPHRNSPRAALSLSIQVPKNNPPGTFQTNFFSFPSTCFQLAFDLLSVYPFLNVLPPPHMRLHSAGYSNNKAAAYPFDTLKVIPFTPASVS